MESSKDSAQPGSRSEHVRSSSESRAPNPNILGDTPKRSSSVPELDKRSQLSGQKDAVDNDLDIHKQKQNMEDEVSCLDSHSDNRATEVKHSEPGENSNNKGEPAALSGEIKLAKSVHHSKAPAIIDVDAYEKKGGAVSDEATKTTELGQHREKETNGTNPNTAFGRPSGQSQGRSKALTIVGTHQGKKIENVGSIIAERFFKSVRHNRKEWDDVSLGATAAVRPSNDPFDVMIMDVDEDEMFIYLQLDNKYVGADKYIYGDDCIDAASNSPAGLFTSLKISPGSTVPDNEIAKMRKLGKINVVAPPINQTGVILVWPHDYAGKLVLKPSGTTEYLNPASGGPESAQAVNIYVLPNPVKVAEIQAAKKQKPGNLAAGKRAAESAPDLPAKRVKTESGAPLKAVGAKAPTDRQDKTPIGTAPLTSLASGRSASSAVDKAKPLKRTNLPVWQSHLYNRLAEQTQKTFDFQGFAAQYGRPINEVVDVFEAIVVQPLLRSSRGNPGWERVDKWGKLQEETSNFLEKDAEWLDSQRKLWEDKIWGHLERRGINRAYVDAQTSDEELDHQAPARGRKNITKTKTVEEAMEDIQAASEALNKARKAEERKTKAAAKKTATAAAKKAKDLL